MCNYLRGKREKSFIVNECISPKISFLAHWTFLLIIKLTGRADRVGIFKDSGHVILHLDSYTVRLFISFSRVSGGRANCHLWSYFVEACYYFVASDKNCRHHGLLEISGSWEFFSRCLAVLENCATVPERTADHTLRLLAWNIWIRGMHIAHRIKYNKPTKLMRHVSV